MGKSIFAFFLFLHDLRHRVGVMSISKYFNIVLVILDSNLWVVRFCLQTQSPQTPLAIIYRHNKEPIDILSKSFRVGLIMFNMIKLGFYVC